MFKSASPLGPAAGSKSESAAGSKDDVKGGIEAAQKTSGDDNAGKDGKQPTATDGKADAPAALISVPSQLKSSAPPPGAGTVIVNVIEARGLAGKDGDTSDPFVEGLFLFCFYLYFVFVLFLFIIFVSRGFNIVALVDSKGKDHNAKKTKHLKKTLTPVWKESLVLDASSAHERVRVSVRDKDTFKTQFLGEALLPMNWIAEQGNERRETWQD